MNWTEVWRLIDARIAKAMRLAGQVATRATLSSVNGTSKVATAEGTELADRELGGAELLQHFGLKSIPPSGCDAITLRIVGVGGHRVVIAEGDRVSGKAPVDLAAGETALYSAGGALVVLRADGSIAITNETGSSLTLGIDGSVVLNGGVLGVARQTDTISLDAPSLLVLNSALASAASGTPPATISSLTGSITSSSTTVRAG